MRFFSLTVLALSSSIMTPSLAAPTADATLVERQTPADAPAALALVNQLYTDIKQYTAVISRYLPRVNDQSLVPQPYQYRVEDPANYSTATSLSEDNSLQNQAKASQTFTAAIASINDLVVTTTSDIKSLGGSATTKRAWGSSSAGEKRQVNPADPTGLVTTLTLILLEVGGALNNIIAILGLTATLSFLGPLVASLSLLLASLIPVVSNILILVGALVNGILGGLSLALAGLVL
ncbi:MAG: hypothetical protein Q9169_006194 [Polycauliona sp. 2 TL-2023]